MGDGGLGNRVWKQNNRLVYNYRIKKELMGLGSGLCDGKIKTFHNTLHYYTLQ